MKSFILLLAIASTSLFAEDLADFKLNPEVHNTEVMPFIVHKGPGKWDNYLVQNIPFEPIADLFKQLLISQRRSLTNRGEAHITVITPIEYWDVLKPQGVTIEVINELSLSKKIQNAKFKILCLGSGEKEIEDKLEKTFFVVVESADLISLRQAVLDLYLSKGGSPDKFNPKNYYPHITLGFTKKDLHESDGVIKNSDSCFTELGSK